MRKEMRQDKIKKLSDCFVLNNGFRIPCLGLGTWRTKDEETGMKAIVEAIQTGYRLIDGAARYHNEPLVGKAIKASGIAREEMVLQSKVWLTERGYDKTKRAFEKTCEDLGVDYLDLYLIHWPASPKQFENWEELNLETWRAMTDLYKEGRIKAIGTSNCLPHHLKALMETEVKPMVNQVEYHPGIKWEETFAYCNAHDILIQAWSPIGRGKLFENEILLKMAEKYQKSVAQICIRWVLQHNVLPLPKSSNPLRVRENASVFDFEISAEDMMILDSMEHVGESGLHPDESCFLLQ